MSKTQALISAVVSVPSFVQTEMQDISPKTPPKEWSRCPAPLAWGAPRRGFGKPTPGLLAARCPTTRQGQSSHILSDPATRDGEWHLTSSAGAVDDGGRCMPALIGRWMDYWGELGKVFLKASGDSKRPGNAIVSNCPGDKQFPLVGLFGIAIHPSPSPHLPLSRPPFPVLCSRA